MVRSEFGVSCSARRTLAPCAVLLGWLCLPCDALEPTERPPTGPSQRESEAPQELEVKPIVVLAEWLRKTLVSDEIRDAVLARLAESPQASSWSVRCGSRLYGIALHPLSTGEGCERTVPAMLHLTRAIAVQEMVLSKAIADRFVAFGLSDCSALHEALIRYSGQVSVISRIRGMEHLTTTASAFAMALIVADESAVTAELTKPQSLGDIRSVYRDVLHERIRGLIVQHDWQPAILTWDHLSSLELITPGLCLDAAYCCSRIEKDDVSVRILNQMLERFCTTTGAEDFEAAGDLALGLACELAEQFATRAYTMASERLLHQVIPPKP